MGVEGKKESQAVSKQAEERYLKKTLAVVKDNRSEEHTSELQSPS